MRKNCFTLCVRVTALCVRVTALSVRVRGLSLCLRVTSLCVGDITLREWGKCTHNVLCFCILLSVHGPHDCCGHIFCSLHDFMTVVAMCCSLHDFIHDCSGHMSCSLHEDFITLKWPHFLFSPWGLHYSQVATCLVLSMRTSLLSSGHMSCSLHTDVLRGCSGCMSCSAHEDFIHECSG